MKSQLRVMLFLFTAVTFSIHSAFSEKLISNSTVNKSSIDPFGVHHGVLRIEADLFNGPCDIQVSDKIVLTECGAGNEFLDMNLDDSMSPVPVQLVFYDIHIKNTLNHIAINEPKLIARYHVRLFNGNNDIDIPLTLKDKKKFRLEVIYE